MNVKGLTIQQIMDMPYEVYAKLPRNELAVITSRLVSAVNKRQRRIEKAGLSTFGAFAGKEKLSVKGKTQQELQKVFTTARYRLNLKTSTVKGARKVKQDFERVMKETDKSKKKYKENSKSWEKEHARRITIKWKAYNRLKELYPEKFVTHGKTTDVIQYDISERIAENPNVTVDELINYYSKKWDAEYEQTEREHNEKFKNADYI